LNEDLYLLKLTKSSKPDTVELTIVEQDNRKNASHIRSKIKGKNDSTELIPSSKKKEYAYYKCGRELPLKEAILIKDFPMFLQIENDDAILNEKFESSNSIIKPPDKNLYLSKGYNFLSLDEINSYVWRVKKETLDSLFKKVKDVWKKYFDIDEYTLNICVADTIFTYFQDKLGMTHYLLFVGDNGTGKSNALTIFEQLGYRPLKDVSISPANIYNFLGQNEEGQGIILEDEVDNIEEQEEKMRIYKAGYTKGAKVTRMYDSSSGGMSKSKEQNRYNTFCFKAFSAEKQPAFYKAKGLVERMFTIHCSTGNPPFDITEVINDAGDTKYKKLNREIEDLRKLLLIFRIINYDKPIPDLELSIKNRDKQLCKPVIRLFQNSDVVNEILDSLTRFVFEKREKKLDSLDSYLFSIVKDLAKSSNGYQISNDDLWTVICSLPGNTLQHKPQSYQTDEFGTLSKSLITKTCEDKFCAKKGHDGKQRALKFDKEVLIKLAENYSQSKQIQIIRKKESNSFNSFNTFWNNIEKCNNQVVKKSSNISTNLLKLQNKNEENSVSKGEVKHQNDIFFRGRDEVISNKALDVLKVLGRRKSIDVKIKGRGLYRKWPGADIWACPNCNDSDDIHYMADHPCRMNKK
jgi:hypothetical protein